MFMFTKWLHEDEWKILIEKLCISNINHTAKTKTKEINYNFNDLNSLPRFPHGKSILQ